MDEKRQQDLWSLWTRGARPRAVGNAGGLAFSTDSPRPQVSRPELRCASSRPSLSSMKAAFELRRADEVDCRVPTLLVVEALDVVDQPPTNRASRIQPEVAVELTLERSKEALSDGVVPAVPAPAHAGLELVGLEQAVPSR